MTSTAAVLTLLWGSVGQASANPIISVGPYTPSTTMPFVVPIDTTGALDLTFWQFDLAYDANDLQINASCDPFSDSFCDFVTERPLSKGRRS